MDAKKQAAATPPLEWITAAIGALIAAALLGLIGWEAATRPAEGPPELTVQAERVVPTSGGYVVEVAVRNRSGRTGAGVRIEGRLSSPGGGEERSEVTLDYVPGRAVRKAGLIFSNDPSRHPVELRVTGYQRP